MTDQYHHGNLKNELIDNAIQMISDKGVEQLSLRQLAMQSGVSHNALYRHYKSKDELVDACREYVTKEFGDYLSKSIEGLDYTDLNTASVLGYAYIQFFRDHPTYFNFIYHSTTSCRIILTLDEVEGNYPPFEVFRKVCVALTEAYHMPREVGLNRLVKSWSVVQGVVSLIISTNVELDGSWNDCLQNIFK